MTTVRLPGISFVIRARNEEGNLAKCLNSLAGIIIPHEIVVILHLCTDGSRAEAEAAIERGQSVKIVTWDHPVSRAGLETLATPCRHPNSLPSYLNMCFSHAKYNWKFKYDADFVASDGLVTWLNTVLPIASTDPVRFAIPCLLGSEETRNVEQYLFNCLLDFGKYMFWEVPRFSCDSRVVEIKEHILSLSPKIMKPYWQDQRWFMDVDLDLELRYAVVLAECGEDVAGMARASHPDCDVFMLTARRKASDLAARGISLYD